MSGAGETNVDGKAHKEGDEVRRKKNNVPEYYGFTTGRLGKA